MDHRNKIKVPDPVVKDLNSKNKDPNTIKSNEQMIQRKGNYDILTNISKGTAFLLQGITENDSKGRNVTI